MVHADRHVKAVSLGTLAGVDEFLPTARGGKGEPEPEVPFGRGLVQRRHDRTSRVIASEKSKSLNTHLIRLE
jgi:hypothetical protein